MSDKEKFLSAWNKGRNGDAFYEQIENIETDFYPLYYYKARGAKKHDKKKALKEIEVCLELLNKGTKESEPKLFEQIAKLTQAIGYKEVYQLAGEIYALNDEYDKSSDCYKKYWYYVEQISQIEDLKSRDSIVVYSFRRFNEHTLSDLVNEEITVSHPSRMNDPFDSPITLWGSEKYLNKICSNDGKEKYIPHFSKSLDYFRIRSFVANRDTYEEDDNILKNILMWSLYADEHKGFCIKYRLSEHFILSKDETKLCHLRILPITYENKLDLNRRTIYTDMAFGYKHRIWEYENEVRLLSYNPTFEGSWFGEPLDGNSQIEEVILGLSCPDNARQTIKNVFKSFGNFSHMEMDENNVYNLIKKEGLYPKKN